MLSLSTGRVLDLKMQGLMSNALYSIEFLVEAGTIVGLHQHYDLCIIWHVTRLLILLK